MRMMHQVFLGLGSNLGDKAALLQEAEELIAIEAGTVTAKANCYETDPVGYASENRYLNTALRIETKLSPQALLRTTESIERQLGRHSKSTGGIYHDRPIDIDILYYDDRIYHYRGLVIPHPRLHLRRFVLEPLCDIAPDWVHPVLKQTQVELLKAL